MLQNVESVTPVPDHVVEISGELDTLEDGQLVGAFHADAQQAARRAVRPIGSDHVPRVHPLFDRPVIDNTSLDPFAVLVQTDEIVAEAHRRRRRRTATLQQQRLVMRLGRPRSGALD